LWSVYLLVIASQAALFVPAAATRLVDGDEGFYALAIELVAHGQEPYEDFWLQHAPLMPYVYGGWSRLAGETWFSLRLLSAVLSIGVGVLLFKHLSDRHHSRKIGLAAVVLYAATGLVVEWLPTVKTYALGTFLVFVAYMVVAGVDSTTGEPVAPWRWFIAGFAAGLAIDVRLLLAAVLPVFFVYAARGRAARAHRVLPRVVHLGLGALLGLLPVVYFFLRDPRRFYVDTLDSQFTRSDLGISASILQKLRTLGELMSGAQIFTLGLAALAFVLSVLLMRTRVPLAAGLTAALLLANLLPTPSYTQYFVIVVPLLVVVAVEALLLVARSTRKASDHRLHRLIRIGAALGLGVWVALGVYAADRLKADGLSSLRRIADVIDDRTRPGEIILSIAPDAVYESHARQLPGVESNFAPVAAARSDLSTAEANEYRILTYGQIEDAIRSRRVRVVVVGPGILALARPWSEILDDSGYEVAARLPKHTVYELTAGR
jgi:hypothetical protein